MNILTNLNTAALAFIDREDTQALALCVEYSLQPERILDAIYQRKNYKCLPAVASLFSLLFKFDQQHPLCVSILLDLFERKEYTVLSSFPLLDDFDLDFFIEQALERKVAIDFDISPLFTEDCKVHYYTAILKEDCLELFLVHEKDIKTSIGENRFYKIVVKNSSLQILRHAGINQEQCKWCVSDLLNDSGRKGPSEKKEELLEHLCSLYDHRALLSEYLVWGFTCNYLPVTKLLIKLGASIDEATKRKMQTKNPKLYMQLFAEDV